MPPVSTLLLTGMGRKSGGDKYNHPRKRRGVPANSFQESQGEEEASQEEEEEENSKQNHKENPG